MKYVLGMVAITIIGTVCFCIETSVLCLVCMLIDYTLLGFNIGLYKCRKERK